MLPARKRSSGACRAVYTNKYMSLSSGKLKHLKALSNEKGIISAAAMDQRGSLQKSIASAKGVDVKAVTPEMMSEFKTAVTRVLTPHASAILLDPEFGLEAAKARSSNAGLLLAYEETGYDNSQPGRLPDLLPHVSAKRIVDWGADAVKILIYYTPFDTASVNDIKHAFIERVGAECEAQDIPFFLEFVGYDPKGGDEKGLEYAKIKPQVVIGSMQEFTKPQYRVDVLKVEVPVNAEFVVHLFERGRQQRTVRRKSAHGDRGRHRLFGRSMRPRDVERRHGNLCQAGNQGPRRLARGSGCKKHQRGKRGTDGRNPMVEKAGNLSRGLDFPFN
jgi:tagatose 1,6-diphosphate aldolase